MGWDGWKSDWGREVERSFEGWLEVAREEREGSLDMERLSV